MQGRYGARADEALWLRLGGQAGLDGYLAAARATPLARWLSGIGDGADTHGIELALRQCWRETVGELARWMPREWQPAVRWCATLIDLPALAWLAAGAVPQRWMEKDPVLAAVPANRLPTGRAAWRAAWRERWPAAAGEDGEALERLAAAVEAHLVRFARLPAADAPAARHALGSEAARWFRRLSFRPSVPPSPSPICCWLPSSSSGCAPSSYCGP
ncbi:hypothetical protein AZOA_46970 [Azoarcus sp. Aa7]|nr:hypothetical protein [Azoarcus sp. Aa7]